MVEEGVLKSWKGRVEWKWRQNYEEVIRASIGIQWNFLWYK